MKILMALDHEFPTDVRVQNEAKALIKAGYEVHLACFTRNSLPTSDVYKKIKIHRIKISGILYKSSVAALTFPLYFKFWIKFLDELMRKHKFDVIHIHDLPLAKVGKMLKVKYNIPLVVDLHENWPALLRVSTHTNTFVGKILSPNTLWVRYEKRILKSADKIIVVVDEAKERLKNLGIDHEKISIVSNTLNISEFGSPSHSPQSDYFTLYYAGGLNYHRGLQTVIQALPIALKQKSNIRLRIAGAGSYRHKLESMVEKMGLGKQVEFLGHLSLKGVAENLAMADVALIPHLKTEHTDSTIPHKLFQYMYINKPIIASNCAPLERIISETSSGVIFSSGSPEDLSEKILQLAKGEVIVTPARKWVEQKYNWDADAKILVETYKLIGKIYDSGN